MKRAVALVTTTALLAGAVLASCTRDSTAPTVRAAAPTLTVTASDTLHQYQHRDSLHRAASKRDIDSIAPDPHLSAKSKRAIARMRAREDSLILAMAIADTTTVVQAPPPPPPPPPPTCTLVGDWNARTQPSLAKPAYLASTVDPVFGTTITRITGDVGTAIGNGVGGNWPSMAKQNYPKDPVWSADGRLMVLKEMSGVPSAGAWLFLDGTTYQVAFSRPGPSSFGGGEARWHPTIPDVMVTLGTAGDVKHWNARTNTATTKVAAVAGYTSNEMGPSEGNVSYDGNYVVAKAIRSSDSHVVARVININAGTVGVVIDLTAAGATALDWVSVSAGGGYVVAMATYDGAWGRIKVWNRATGALVGYYGTNSDTHFSHADLGLDQSGNEVIFGATAGIYNHMNVMQRLDNGQASGLTPVTTDYNYHSSTRNNARPGWGLFSDNHVPGGYPFDGEIYAVRLGGGQFVQRLAHHRAINQAYNDAPMPVPSPDGRRVVFSSNWGTAGGPIQTYVVDTRQLCPNGLPQ
jgi:hypothetical protein